MVWWLNLSLYSMYLIPMKPAGAQERQQQADDRAVAVAFLRRVDGQRHRQRREDQHQRVGAGRQLVQPRGVLGEDLRGCHCGR
jgi:hypothetical protein